MERKKNERCIHAPNNLRNLQEKRPRAIATAKIISKNYIPQPHTNTNSIVQKNC